MMLLYIYTVHIRNIVGFRSSHIFCVVFVFFSKNGAYSNDLSEIGKHDGNHRSLSTWFSVKHVGI